MKLILRIFLFIFLCLLLALVAVIYARVRTHNVRAEKVPLASTHASLQQQHKESKRVGEKLVYDVKMGSMRLGTSVLRHLPGQELRGRWLQVLSFKTDLARFKDEETIYSDPQTFLPVRVERDIQNWFVKEEIIETYDQLNHTLTVVKSKGKQQQTTTIEKDGPLHHPILLPQYVRDLPRLAVGQVFEVRLPRKDFLIKIVETEEITVPAGTFTAYHCESSPRQIAIWISADQKRLPLKIQGLGFLNYILVLREYNTLDDPNM